MSRAFSAWGVWTGRTIFLGVALALAVSEVKPSRLVLVPTSTLLDGLSENGIFVERPITRDGVKFSVNVIGDGCLFRALEQVPADACRQGSKNCFSDPWVRKRHASLFVALRQRIMTVPLTYARRLTQFKGHSRQPRNLEALSVSLLNELKTDRGDSPFDRNCGSAF